MHLTACIFVGIFCKKNKNNVSDPSKYFKKLEKVFPYSLVASINC